MTEQPLIDISPENWRIVSDILQRLVPDREVWAFGSRAKWSAKEYSDLDIAIIGDEPLGLTRTAELTEAFQDSALPFKVDVVDWATITPSFRQVIEASKIVLIPRIKRSSWHKTTLGTLLSFANGRTSPERDDYGAYEVFGSNGSIGRANVSNAPPNAIVIGRVGSYCGSLHYSPVASWITDNAICATAKDGNNPKFLLYLLQTLNLNNWRSGSGQPLLNQSILSAIPASVPDLSLQNEIAEVLGSFDDRIILLKETNTTLEAIAQALFKSWFVDFDPVRAKAEGREPEGVPPEIAELFPSEFEDSELGEIPKGWQITRVGDVLELAYGKALKATDRMDGDVPVYGSGGITGFHNQALVDGPSVIVGRKGTVGSLYWEDRKFFPIDTVFFVKPLKAPLSYCYYMLQTLGLKDMNTDAAVPGLNRENVYRLKVSLPSAGLLELFDEYVSLLRKKIFIASEETRGLSAIRDSLLPKLMSGTLAVDSN